MFQNDKNQLFGSKSESQYFPEKCITGLPECVGLGTLVLVRILWVTHHTGREMVAIIRKSKTREKGGINYIATAPETIAP